MGGTLDSVTIGELMGVLAVLAACYMFVKSFVVPLVQKWLKIDKTAHDLDALQSLPERVSTLEIKAEKDWKHFEALDEVNVLMVEALMVLLKNSHGSSTDADAENLEKVEAKIEGYLVGKVKVTS